MKPFSLAGLLRIRQTQQDVAGAQLARANTRVRDNAATEKRARRALADFGEATTETETLRAIAAARQASATILADLVSVGENEVHERDRAQEEYNTARKRALGLEKLEHKHQRAETSKEQKTEQLALDELTSHNNRTEGDES